MTVETGDEETVYVMLFGKSRTHVTLQPKVMFDTVGDDPM